MEISIYCWLASDEGYATHPYLKGKPVDFQAGEILPVAGLRGPAKHSFGNLLADSTAT